MKSTGKKLSRRDFLKLSLGVLAEFTLLGGGGLAYASQLEPGWVQVVSLNLILPRLPGAFDGFQIAQISDIHIGTWMTGARLQAVVDRINTLGPDLVAITGDFVHRHPHQHLDELVTSLGSLSASIGVLAVLGNHDHWTNAGMVREVLASARITDLSNQVHTLRRENTTLSIAGVDDYWEKQDRLDLVLDSLPDNGTAILLVHEPDYADLSAATGRFDLQLSGHSHGGQVNLPFFGPPILPFLGEKYPAGLYQVGNMYQYTNRGIGMTNPALRFNCRPEITLLTLHSPDSGHAA
jgi:predicted MPP superfamily phosphohydrolase